MTDSAFVRQQDHLDALVKDYLARHPNFVAHAQEKDAALKGIPLEEVRAMLTAYPGVIAVAAHEEAHALYTSGSAANKVKARRLSEAAHSRSGIDIHPGTSIGENCFIDHGTGVVIGETAKLGEGTLLYHDVTLGAYGNPEEKNPQKLAHRHPEIGNYCTVSVGAKVLGNVKIRNGVTLGPNATLFGNSLVIGNKVSVGAGAQIGDDNQLADGIRVGAGAVIPRGVGVIDRNVPAYSHVIRNAEGELEFGATISLEALRRFIRQPQPQADHSVLNYQI